ncbi:MAG TPA: hypothetical protein VD713_00530, partial [Sphingomonadales bacterium]|nr:hypothetical protein [Sphingomonadales bacterium]
MLGHGTLFFADGCNLRLANVKDSGLNCFERREKTKLDFVMKQNVVPYRLLVGLFVLLAGMSSGNACQDQNIAFPAVLAGSWSGEAARGGETWKIDLQFTETPVTGCFELRVSFPDGGVYFIKPENISTGKKAFSFDVPGAPWRVEASFNSSADEISGTWLHTRDAVSAGFRLARVADDPVRLTEEDIEFTSPDGATLAGTLILP